MKQLIKNNIIRLRLKFLFRLYSVLRTLYWRLLLKLNVGITKTRRYQLETSDVMRRILNKDSNCVDVGCHEGAVLKEILKFSPDGKHYAFEPIPKLYQALTSRFPDVHVSDIALNDTKGWTTFYDIVSRRGHSGLRSRNLEQTEEMREITVQTDLLDNLISRDISIHFMKIDVEGAELAVLKGAINTICKNKPTIVFEHGLGGADFFDTSPKDIYELLVKECGLQISTMKNWLNDESSMNQEEFIKQFKQHDDYYFIAYE